MIVWKMTDGLAHDMRYEEDNYALLAGEQSLPGWSALPSLDSISDPVAVAARDAAKEAEAQRVAGILADPTAQDLLNRLKTATPTQISNYIDNNVTDLASARAVLKRILLVLALLAQGG